ncbi:MAG TPA: hypothetical protein VFK03_02580 [Candidatus Saccharimonadales bacterium]|nr:hypothetical protein [Candidatus Saccharimonadales bacterium]
MEKQVTDTTANPVTDDQELANVLAGMNGQAATSPTDDSKPADDSADTGLQYEATGEQAAANEAASSDEPVAPTLDELEKTVAADDANETPEVAVPAPAAEPASSTLPPELDSIKKDAVAELRPLVDKLDLPADEKFDTLLLIIRSTDDQSLLSTAHEAAKAIDDDGKRAQALLDVIKEIDYFANQPK